MVYYKDNLPPKQFAKLNWQHEKLVVSEEKKAKPQKNPSQPKI